MNRPWQVWLAFGLCLSVVLAAMGWMSLTVLRLDRNEQAARVQSQREENARLALWRMDSALAPLTAQESARPYFAYGSFYSAARPYGNMVYDNTGNLNDRNSNNPNLYNKQHQDELLLPSPLLTQTASNALIHFQIDEQGVFTSPQVPTGTKLDMAAAVCATNDHVNLSSQRLVALRGSVAREQLLAITPEPPAGPQQAVRASSGRMAQYINNDEMQLQLTQQDQAANSPQQKQQQAEMQGAKNRAEFQKRAQNVQRQEVANYAANADAWGANGFNSNIPIPVSMDVREGAMKAAWMNGNLVLARRVILNGKTFIQGCWMDWENIKKWLVEDIRDLLPEAELIPVVVENLDRTEYRLAALPVKLKPGQLPGECALTWSPIQISLLIAWICVLLGAAAVAALLLGAVTLSERRGAFVSAVTHELRTPLTTFRMYTEMLQGGMITDEGKRNRYLNTLRVEAERLSHLVENVLAYAKLERGVKGKRVEPITLRDLIGRTKQRLSDRAEQAGLQIVVEGSAADFDALAKTDPSAIEQILFNLVDNASKYATNAKEKVIRIAAERVDGRVALRVSDSGPGFSAEERKRLFRPFSKSASEAAHSAPGVGLGLALSRRLARDMGGDLKFDVNVKTGASFVVTMPAASPQESHPGAAESSASPAS